MHFKERILNENTPDYHNDGVLLKFQPVYKELGINVDVKLKFHCHVDIIGGHTGSLLSNLLRSPLSRSIEFIVSLWLSHLYLLTEYDGCLKKIEF